MMEIVTVRDGQRLHVRVIGRGQPVVLLHGLGANGAMWLPFVWPYLHRFRFYIPDMRGAGRSADAGFNQADFFQNHAQDLQDIVSHFGLNDFLLAGHSLGGTTALHWQREGGFAKVRRYLHIDQSPAVRNAGDWTYGLFGADQDEVFSMLRSVLAVLDTHPECMNFTDLPATVQQQVGTTLETAFSRITGKSLLMRMLQALQRLLNPSAPLIPVTRLADLTIVLSSYLAGHDYRDSLRDCRTPITVMVGMHSVPYAPEGQIAIAKYAENCNVVRFEKSGHLPMLDQPLQFIRELGRFLAERVTA